LRPAPGDFGALARAFKTLRPIVDGLSDIETAISVAGGVKWDQLDDALMITSVPGVYCAGEMIDWEAPTGGYLLTACFATGRWAAQSALARLNA
jgi:predicted flavoprotein YhiN